MDWPVLVSFILFLIIALLSGMRLPFVLALVGIIFIYYAGGITAFGDIIGYACWNSINSFVLVAIPLFVLMGNIIMRTGVAESAYTDLTSWLHHFPGRLLVTNIAACAIFAAISGSSVATTVTIGNVAVPIQRTKGYKASHICGTIAAGGTLGILIPPSIAFIIYGSLTEQSVGKLFIAGVIPGLILAGLFILYIVVNSKVKGDMAPPSDETYTWRDRVYGLKSLIPVIFLLLMIMGTIYTGIATATEAAGMGVLGAFIIAILLRKLSLKLLKESFVDAINASSWLLFLLVSAHILGYGMSLAGVPQQIAQVVSKSGLSHMTIIILLVLMYIVLGCLADPISMLLMTMPVVYPILLSIEADLIWFGVIIVLLMETSLVTPPVGMNLFVVMGVTGVDLNEVIHGVVPYIIMLFIMIAIIITFPILATWLPSHMLL